MQRTVHSKIFEKLRKDIFENVNSLLINMFELELIDLDLNLLCGYFLGGLAHIAAWVQVCSAVLKLIICSSGVSRTVLC